MIDQGVLLGRGVAFPVNVGADGRIPFSVGAENIREAIRIILLTEVGERVRLVDFGAGLSQFLFEPNTTTTQRQIQDRIVQSLATWEPRITVDSVVVGTDPNDAKAAIAAIAYRLVATQAQEQVTVSVQVAG